MEELNPDSPYVRGYKLTVELNDVCKKGNYTHYEAYLATSSLLGHLLAVLRLEPEESLDDLKFWKNLVDKRLESQKNTSNDEEK